MTHTADQARKFVFAAIAAVNQEIPGDNKMDAADETALIGPDSALDSLRLINLVVHVENAIEEDLDLEIPLTEAPELFETDGPLATAGDFIAHVAALIDSETP